MLSVDIVKEGMKKVFGVETGDVMRGTGLVKPVTPEMRYYDEISVREDRKSRIIDCVKMGVADPRIALLSINLPQMLRWVVSIYRSKTVLMICKRGCGVHNKSL